MQKIMEKWNRLKPFKVTRISADELTTAGAGVRFGEKKTAHERIKRKFSSLMKQDYEKWKYAITRKRVS